MSQIVSLSFYRFDGLRDRAWAFAMMGFNRWSVARVPGIGFWKLCGSGSGVGFAARPNPAVCAILATWPDHATARRQLVTGPFARHAARAAEAWTVLLSPTSVRGDWSGRHPFVAGGTGADGRATDPATAGPAESNPIATGPAAVVPAAAGPATIGPATIGPAATDPAVTGRTATGPAAIGRTAIGPAATGSVATGPVAALTRATIRRGALRRFWRRVPYIADVVGRDPNVLFKIGIGEVPWLHQITFSIWPDAAAMAGFARTGPHADAIRAVRSEGWFAEELYARFAIAGDIGTWGGASPLAGLEGRTAA